MQSTEDNFDIIIAGGGMVGLTLAAILKHSPFRVAVVENHEPAPFSAKQDYDLRVSAISRASAHVLHHVGAWDGILSRRYSPYDQMQVWDQGGQGLVHFDAADLVMDYLGYIIENPVVQLALLDSIRKAENIHWLCPEKIQAIYPGDQGTELVLGSGSKLEAHLLVGADGAHSQVRHAAGIDVDRAEYGQQALVCVVKTSKSHRNTAWQRFLSTGPLAFLPLADGRCSIVWSVEQDRAEALLQLDDQKFSSQLGQAFEYQLGQVESVGPRAAFPLVRRHAKSYVQPGLCLIGDAAHTIHPLAGQGVNLGILDAAALAQVLMQAWRQKRDIASLATLRKYERWRRGENALMMYSMSGFKQLFSNDNLLLQSLRNTGLNLVNRIPPLKHRFMRQAMGLEGDLPEIARVVNA